MNYPDENVSSVAGVSAPALKEKKSRCIRTDVAIADNRVVPVYAGKRVADALAIVTDQMTIWKGVKLAQVLEAVYDQGKKDGARSVFDSVDNLKHAIPHRNPGKPKKNRKRK